MVALENKNVLVIGLGARGRAACDLLRRRGARVTAVDRADTEELRAEADRLLAQGILVELGASRPPEGNFDLAVVSPVVPGNAQLTRELSRQNVPMIGELELGFQQAQCLTIGIAGTNGKSTTADLVEQMLRHNHRSTVQAGHRGSPICAVADKTKELDFLTLQVNSFQLETTEFFRPAVAVLLNLMPDHLDRYARMADYVRANARLFRNQQPFDWAIVQSEALAHLLALDIELPSKVITFSAHNRRADIYLDRGLLVSRLDGWSGPLLDMDHCKLRGPHNAENLMAALAVGRVLRLPLDGMVEALKEYASGPHRCELVAEVNGVQFVNDSKATNLAALQMALRGVRSGKAGEPNVWLIAGGRDKGLDYHDLGPLISQRVKHAMLIGEARKKIRAAWSLFTPCTLVDSLLEAVQSAAGQAAVGDVILLSPACSSFDQFRNYQHRGEVFRQAVRERVARAARGEADPVTKAVPARAVSPPEKQLKGNE